MPVPVRDNGDPGPEKRLLVFVHGFCSDANTWEPLIKLVRADAPVAAQFDLECFNYTTGPFAVPVVNRLPTVAEIAAKFDGWLWEKYLDPVTGLNRYIDITLVGHSMGGLVIQQWLAHMLEAGKGHQLHPIRQTIFFATPHLGSMTMEGLRGFLGGFIKNPQEEMLRGLNQQVAELHHTIEQRVLRATRREEHRYPLPGICFWGLEDNIVPEISARGFFPVSQAVDGNHTALHCPKSLGSDTYKIFADALEHPHGHAAAFEVALFRYSAKVKPLPPGTTREVKYGQATRLVETDNEAQVVRQVTFGRHNNCRNDFDLKYRTRNSGFIAPVVMPKIAMRPDHQSRYEETGTEVNFQITPEPGQTYTLNMTVFRGFEAGHRDYHQHFTNHCYFRRVRFEVDLTEYLRAGWQVSDPPKLYYHPDDRDDHSLCALRDWLTPDPATGAHSPGQWRWELEHIHHGVLDVKWDVKWDVKP